MIVQVDDFSYACQEKRGHDWQIDDRSWWQTGVKLTQIENDHAVG